MCFQFDNADMENGAQPAHPGRELALHGLNNADLIKYCRAGSESPPVHALLASTFWIRT